MLAKSRDVQAGRALLTAQQMRRFVADGGVEAMSCIHNLLLHHPGDALPLLTEAGGIQMLEDAFVSSADPLVVLVSAKVLFLATVCGPQPVNVLPRIADILALQEWSVECKLQMCKLAFNVLQHMPDAPRENLLNGIYCAFATPALVQALVHLLIHLRWNMHPEAVVSHLDSLLSCQPLHSPDLPSLGATLMALMQYESVETLQTYFQNDTTKPLRTQNNRLGKLVALLTTQLVDMNYIDLIGEFFVHLYGSIESATTHIGYENMAGYIQRRSE